MAHYQPQKSPDLIKSMSRISHTTHLHQPPSFTSDSPTILLLTWMNATPCNISFYIQHYTLLFPSARIIVFRGIIPNMVYSPESTQISALQPAISALLAYPTSPIILHLFSNSGSQQAGLLLRAYKRITGSTLPLKSMILDSSPSIGTFSRGYTGVAYEIPKKNPLIRITGLALVWILIVIMGLWEKVSGRMNVIAQANWDLRDEALLGKEVKRWYLYSREDGLVRWDDVEWHADEIEKKGWVVHREVFDGSAHCRHGKEEEKRYWAIVKGAVEHAVRDGKILSNYNS